MPKMRAKMIVTGVVPSVSNGVTQGERLTLRAVGTFPYPSDGSDEDNTYARWSPDADLSIYVANPDLIGKFEIGEKYYVDFTRAEA